MVNDVTGTYWSEEGSHFDLMWLGPSGNMKVKADDAFHAGPFKYTEM